MFSANTTFRGGFVRVKRKAANEDPEERYHGFYRMAGKGSGPTAALIPSSPFSLEDAFPLQVKYKSVVGCFFCLFFGGVIWILLSNTELGAAFCNAVKGLCVTGVDFLF